MRRRLEQLSLRTQIVATIGSIALVAALLTYSVVAVAVEVSLERLAPAAVDSTLRVLRPLLLAVVGCVALAAFGAAAFLRASIGDSVRGMRSVTAAIASGQFDQRVDGRRPDELGELASSINDMAAQLEQLEVSRRQLLASVSHELRTPLTIIRGHAYTLSRGESDRKRSERFELIDQETQRLAELIEDLLLAATLQAAPLGVDRESACMRELAADLVLRFQPMAAEHGVRVRLRARREELSAAIDSRRIEQVIGNLLSNAIAHAPGGSTVELSVRASADLVRCAVSNGGRAIPLEEQATITEPFVQGARSTGSVGLGLSIAADLLSAHGAKLCLRSSANRTVFWFDLPLCESRVVAQTRLRAQPA